MKILARSQFCLLTILHLQLVVCHSKFHVEIFVQFNMIKNILESFIQSENSYQYQESYILFYIWLMEHANAKFKKRMKYIIAAAVKTIMLLPCVRLQFLGEIDEKCAEAWNCWPLCHTCNKEQYHFSLPLKISLVAAY